MDRLKNDVVQSDAWTLTHDRFEIGTARAYEGLFALGSGYLQTRGSFEEHFADSEQNSRRLRQPANVTAEKFEVTPSKWGTYIPGVFGEHPLLLHEMINLPWFLELAPVIEGERLDLTRSRHTEFRCTLNMKTASLARTLTWQLPSGNRVRLCFERFISGQRSGLSVQRLTLVAEQAAELAIEAGIVADVTTNGFDHFTEVTVAPSGQDGIRCEVTTDGGDRVTMESRFRSDTSAVATVVDTTACPRVGKMCKRFVLEAGVPLVLEKLTAVATSRDLLERPVTAQLAAALPMAWDGLFAEHAAFWAAQWETSDVQINGDAQSQRIMRCSIYHLLRAHVPGDPRVAIEAKGYAGEAYKGHYFWDTEMYLLPFYLYTQPERAKTLVDFRVGCLPESQRIAAGYGYRGARYAWEVDTKGRSCCCDWQYRDHEVHVTADVVYGLAHYHRAMELPISGKAAEVVVETARYWMDRLDWRHGEDYPSLLGVMGPDEYAPITNNNAYTNWLVSMNLSLAADLGPAGGATEAESAAFASAAAGLPVVRSKKNPDLILQCEGFESLAEPRFDEYWADRKGCYAARVSQERLYRSKNLKQADVILLMALFPDAFRDAEVQAAWDTYLPVTTHDSSLSAGIHAIIALRLGLDQEAWEFFLKSADMDLDVAHGGAAQGIHIAGCGSNWQVVLLGFAGMRTAMQSDVLRFDPALPAHWQQLCFPMVWKGVPLRVSMTHEGTTITNRGERAITVNVSGKRMDVEAGESREWRR